MFLAAAASRLRDLGADKPFRQLFGVDVDPAARRYIATLADREAENGNFVAGDFLETRCLDARKKVECVIGNPPYVRHHTMSEGQLAIARAALEAAGRPVLPRTAGYWAYFVLHSLQFLRAGGRLAMVLPLAFMDGNYAAEVRRIVAAGFRSVRVLVVRERLFLGTDQACVILLADGFDQTPVHSSIESVDTAADIQEACRREPDRRSRVLVADSFGWRAHLLSPSVKALLSELADGSRSNVVGLGSIASVRIGTVTGANHFFVLSWPEARRLALPDAALRPILARTAQLPPLALTTEDWARIRAEGERSLLFCPHHGRPAKSVQRYLRSTAARVAKENGHCARREPWYRIPDTNPPDAFVPYVNDVTPRIVLNLAHVACTNAIHRIWWKKPVDQGMIALSSLSSLAAISAEVYGRSCGGGALKLELKELLAMRLAVPDLDAAVLHTGYQSAVEALNAGERQKANAISNGIILGRGLGLSEADRDCLAQGFEDLRLLRIATPQPSDSGVRAVSA